MGDFKILFMIVPRICYDKSMHDKTTDFGEVIQYIIDKFEDKGIDVTVKDFSVIASPLRHVYKQFKENYDLAVMFTDVADARISKKVGKYLKEISPNTKLMIYGDATLVIPQYFKCLPYDAFYLKGDQEAAIEHYIRCIRGEEKYEDLKGICYRDENGKYIEKNDYYRISVDEWAYLALDYLPIDEYQNFARKYKGNEYTCAFYVSKGCKNNCKYCLCSKREGIDERRRDVISCVDFIEQHQNKFKKYKLHSADLTSDRKWLEDFCNEIIRRKINIKWKATICIRNMDYDLAKLCYEAGAYGFGFGVETFYKNNGKGAKVSVDNFEKQFEELNKIPIRWKAYIMFNMPNQKYEDVMYTISILNKLNIVIRASSYTPFYLLTEKTIDELDNLNIEEWNKKEFLDWNNDYDENMWKEYVKRMSI